MKRPLVFVSLALCLLQGCMSHQATLPPNQDPAAVENVVAQQGSGSPDAPPLKEEKHSDMVAKNIVKVIKIGSIVLVIVSVLGIVYVLSLAKSPPPATP